jgi:hypothetical protein
MMRATHAPHASQRACDPLPIDYTSEHTPVLKIMEELSTLQRYSQNSVQLTRILEPHVSKCLKPKFGRIRSRNGFEYSN